MSATVPLREALNESISSGRFEDTQIILYSRRDVSGDVCGPRALYASSHVLKTVPYFNDRESPTRAPLADQTANNSLLVLSGTFTEADSRDFIEALDNNETAEDYGYYSDSDLEDDSDNIVPSAKGPLRTAAPLKDHPLDHPSSSAKDRKPPHTYGDYGERPQQGKVIKVQDVAFITHVSVPKQKATM